MRIITTFLAASLLGIAAPAYSQVVLTEDFEGITTPALPTDWQNKTASAGGWKTHSGQLNFNVNNWRIPATSSKYAVIDDFNAPTDINNPARLVTPSLDVSTLNVPVLSFKYFFINAVTNTGVTEAFYVEASVDSGRTWEVVDSVSIGNPTAWQDKNVSLYKYIGEDALMVAFSFSDKGGRFIGAAVDDIKVYEWDKAPYDAALTGITPNPALKELVNAFVSGSNVTLGGFIENRGAFPITDINVHYQITGSTIVSDNITGLNIKPFNTAAFTTTTPYTLPATTGAYPGKIWVDLINDTTDNNDTGATTLYSVASKPAKKILAEEGTGTWCGWCPRGHVFMDSVAHSPTHKQSFTLVAVHNSSSDPMTVPAYDAKVSALIGNSYPGMTIDRRDRVDPSDLFAVYGAMKDYFGFADITLTDVPEGGFNYSVKASVKPAIDLSGDYRLALAITEDGIVGSPDGSDWDQANYYSFQYNNVPLVGSGLDWQREPGKVPASKIRYNHVARGIFPNANGAAGSLPATMTVGTSYDYTFKIPMEPYWRRNNMHAVVMLIRASDGQVLNSNDIVIPLSVSDVAAGINGLKIYPNPTANKAIINFTQANAGNVDIVVTDMMGRTVQTINKENFSAGAHQVNIDLSAVTAGIYNVTVTTETGSVATRLSVVK